MTVDGAQAAFGCAFQAYITGMGLLTDELEDTQLAAAGWDWDRRSMLQSGGNYATSACEGTQQFGVYSPMQTARYTANLALTNLSAFSDDEVAGRTALMARAAVLGGYASLLLGEGFCSMAFDGGPELTPAQVFAVAEGKFTEAITHATAANNSSLLNAARVGRARSRLNLAKLPGQAVVNGKLTEARADAAAVPAGFVYNMPYATNVGYSRNNIFVRNQESRLYGVAPRYQAMTFDGVPDPRVVVDVGPIGQDNLTPSVYIARKYNSQSAPIALASYDEARLIMAEADYHLVGPEAAVPYINALHTAASLPAFASTDATEILNQIVEERSRELFLESQRGYDYRRFNIPFDPAVGVTFQIPQPRVGGGTANRPKGGTYGDVRCLPLPDVERNNNPNF
ncbi:MAG: RagB/SusD family nutrient uptake outer membrane protein [Gemmatimonadales bacterium]